MKIVSAIGTVMSVIVGRKKVEKQIEKMRDYPTCLSCSKETLKIIEEKWCFQCFYADKSNEHH
jgi:ribosomal protein L37AE/L43A